MVGWIVYRVRKAVVATGKCRSAGKAWKRREVVGKKNLAGVGFAVRRSEAVMQ